MRERVAFAMKQFYPLGPGYVVEDALTRLNVRTGVFTLFRSQKTDLLRLTENEVGHLSR